MFSFDEFEDMCEKLAEAWQQILIYEESILAKLREFAPVLSNLR